VIKLLKGSNLQSSMRWYALRTLPRKEAIAEVHLARQGFRAFLPRIIVTRRHARKFEINKVALFPRYAFVLFDVDRHRWRSVNGTLGVETLLMSADRPLPVPITVVEEILAAADEDGVVDLNHGFTPGSRVRLVTGPFAGVLGTLIKLDEKGRVDLLLRMMNTSVRLKVPRDILERAT
jgi:transcription elongation factor/antiterminator RfaH